jgi:hypothetical protein
MTAVEGAEGLEYGEFLQFVLRLAFAAYARGVDEEIGMPAVGKQGVDRVTGCAGDFGHHHPLLAHDRVHHR